MKVKTRNIEFQSKGNSDVIDITNDIHRAVQDTGISNGTITLFTPSSTSAITTVEFESGCISDLRRLFDELADPKKHYAHNARWGDGNGHSHVRAALLGPSLSIPVVDGKLTLGTWQQIIFVDFDNRERHRRLLVQVIGE